MLELFLVRYPQEFGLRGSRRFQFQRLVRLGPPPQNDDSSGFTPSLEAELCLFAFPVLATILPSSLPSQGSHQLLNPFGHTQATQVLLVPLLAAQQEVFVAEATIQTHQMRSTPRFQLFPPTPQVWAHGLTVSLLARAHHDIQSQTQP